MNSLLVRSSQATSRGRIIGIAMMKRTNRLLIELNRFAAPSMRIGSAPRITNRIVECAASRNMWPPSKGIIGIRLANPRMKFIQANQNRKSKVASIPSVPRVEASGRSPANSMARCASGSGGRSRGRGVTSKNNGGINRRRPEQNKKRTLKKKLRIKG